MADFRHLSDTQLADRRCCAFWQQNNPGSQQVLSILPANWLAGRTDYGRGMCSDASVYRLRFQNMDQQHRLEQQRYLLHNRLSQSPVQSGWPRWCHTYHRRNA